MLTCCGGAGAFPSPTEGSRGRRGGRGGGGRGLGGGQGGGGIDTGGRHGEGEEEPNEPPVAVCGEETVGDVAGELLEV